MNKKQMKAMIGKEILIDISKVNEAYAIITDTEGDCFIVQIGDFMIKQRDIINLSNYEDKENE